MVPHTKLKQTTPRRVCILMMDSFGLGASEDAFRYQDEQADTFGHIFEAAQQGRADKLGVRQGPLHIPNLTRLGLLHAAAASTGRPLVDLSHLSAPEGYYGYAVENSLGKDTPSGHWELMGVPVFFEWGYFQSEPSVFPPELIENFIEKAKLPGVLGLTHASGTEIIRDFGQLHCETGKPIVYTSADSVFQIAAHETHFGLERLYEICEIARQLVDEYRIGRVIARPFIGEAGNFQRTGNRRDYSIPPPSKTLLDDLCAANRAVIALGKVSDIFAHQGISQCIKADGNEALFEETLRVMEWAPEGSLVFTNFVDFDSAYGHRRDVPGYAHALEIFDQKIPELEAILQPNDWVVIVADHGCDPTLPGSDHTREHIPVLVFGPKVSGRSIGRRASFADVGQSIAQYLGVAPLEYGLSFCE